MRQFGALKNLNGENWYETDDGVQLPYIGPVLDYKDDDPQHLRPQMRYNACVGQFNLDNEDDMKQYRALCDKICRQQAIVSYEEKEYDDVIKSWRILVRWMEPYYGPPATALRHVREEAKANKGKLPRPRTPRPIRKEDLPPQRPGDLAQAEAQKLDDLRQIEPDSEVESDNEIPSRYGTFDEIVSVFGDVLPELGRPLGDGEDGQR